MSKTLKLLKDSSGTTIVGELVGETETTVTLRNPAGIYVQPGNAGQLTVQLLPVVLRELLSQTERDETLVDYSKASIALVQGEKALEKNLADKYESIFGGVAPVSNAAPGTPLVEKLFDD